MYTERKRAAVIFRIDSRQLETDLDIPLDISAQELIQALNEVFQLGIDVTDIRSCYLRAEEPIVLLKGGRLLSEFGIRDGSILLGA